MSTYSNSGKEGAPTGKTVHETNPINRFKGIIKTIHSFFSGIFEGLIRDSFVNKKQASEINLITGLSEVCF